MGGNGVLKNGWIYLLDYMLLTTVWHSRSLSKPSPLNDPLP